MSARQLADPSFPGVVAAAVADNGVQADQLALEFTESALIAANPITEMVLVVLICHRLPDGSGRLPDCGGPPLLQLPSCIP